MKRPIEPADIRAGDLIRCEWKESDAAEEWRSPVDAGSTWDPAKVDHFLLDRPTPPVELPTEPTYGVLEWTAGPNTANPGESRRVAATWKLSPYVSGYYRPEGRPTQIHAVDFGMYIPLGRVTAFTPAVAVPMAALNKLRKAENVVRVNDFLAAVDEANRA